MAKKATNKKENLPMEEVLWKACDALRGSIEPSEYKHVVLSLIFLKYAGFHFDKRRREIINDGLEDFVDSVEFYAAKNVFYLPETARWTYIKENAKQPNVASIVDKALSDIEKENKPLRGALPNNYYSSLGIEAEKLGSLLDKVDGFDTILESADGNDIIGRVYEYSNYKRLGNYIRQVDVRNRDLVVNKLLGLSIAKQFITSIANTTGTDMSTYKIVQPRQFGYVPVTSRNGDKITIALYEGESPCIISQAYIVFEVIDETELLPEYLMMWFRRPEFDRYARFKSHGSAREVFEWSEMCDVMLPVPPIEEQRKIVSEYQAIEQRIENNRRLITTLEETAKAIYRKMFVDDIDPENLSEGWRMGKLGEVITISSGQSLSDKVDIQTDDYKYPVAGASGIIGYSRWHNQNEPFITTGRVGTIGVVNRYLSSAWAADNVLVAKSPYYEYAYQVLKNVNYQKLIGGGVQNLITQTSLTNIEMMIPPLEKIELYVKSINGIAGLSICLDKENWIMECLQTNFLSKLSNY